MNDFVPFNEVYKTVFTTEFPAQNLLLVARLPRDVKVESEVIAEIKACNHSKTKDRVESRKL